MTCDASHAQPVCMIPRLMCEVYLQFKAKEICIDYRESDESVPSSPAPAFPSLLEVDKVWQNLAKFWR